RAPHLYGAAALSAACLTPVLVWNFANANASLRYNFVDRLSLGWTAAMTVEHLLAFALLAPLSLSPLLLPALWRLARGRVPDFMAAWRPLALASLAVSTLACLLVALRGPALYYWNLPAYAALLPWAALLMGRVALRGHLALGVIAAVAFTANYALVPLTALYGAAADESAMAYGWSHA